MIGIITNKKKVKDGELWEWNLKETTILFPQELWPTG